MAHSLNFNVMASTSWYAYTVTLELTTLLQIREIDCDGNLQRVLRGGGDCSILPVQIGKERPPPEQVQVHVPMDCYEWYKELKMECPGCGILRCKRDWTPAQWDTQDPCIHGRQFCMVCDQWTQLQGQHRSQGARSSSTFGISLQEPQAGCLIGILFHGLWNIPHFNRSVFHPKKN